MRPPVLCRGVWSVSSIEEDGELCLVEWSAREVMLVPGSKIVNGDTKVVIKALQAQNGEQRVVS